MRGIRVVIAVGFGLLLPFFARAATYDVQIQRSDVTFRPERFFVGGLVRVYATVKNVGEKDVQGNVFFSENGTAIGTPPPFSVRARGAEEEVWVDWQPVTTGDRQIFIRVVTAPETRDENVANNEMIVPIFIDRDSDGDGIGDRDEPPPIPPAAVAAPTGAGVSSVSPSAPVLTVPAPTPSPRIAPAAKPVITETARRLPPGGVPARIDNVRPVTAPASTAVEPATPPSEPAANRAPYDTQLRDLLGSPAPRWRTALPFIAGGIAAIAVLIALVLWIRRRLPHDTDDEENLGPRPPRSR